MSMLKRFTFNCAFSNNVRPFLSVTLAYDPAYMRKTRPIYAIIHNSSVITDFMKPVGLSCAVWNACPT
jgi:hypothetical protein